ncbi:MAG: NPCBM/NEW2 domain-containing protein [Sphingobacteriaceae bacterium]
MRTNNLLRYALLAIVTFFGSVSVHAQSTDTLWLQKIDLKRFTQDWTLTPKAFLALGKNPLILAKQAFKNGLASRTEAVLKFNLDGKAQQFHSLFGVDDAANKKARVILTALADNKEVFRSPVMTAGSKPIEVNLHLKNVKQLSLILDDGGTGLYLDRANYVNAFIAYNGETPEAFNFNYINKRHILTPPTSPKPKINGARVFGVRPGRPFIFTIAATGNRPMTFNALNLPKGLSLNPQTGIITGVIHKKGESLVTINAKNKLGTSTRNLKIVVGEKIALTPPMGWNEYNRYGDKINQATMKASVDAMVSSGLINHGWTYINIDDGWSIKPGSDDPMNWGEPRDANGMINANKKFPDMKELTDYIHAKGFKAGIYSSPGPLTCSRFTASYQFEEKDAQRWANWGFDYLKYDYCTYGDLFKSHDLDTLQKPYIVMRKALDKVNRDVFFSFSQYGIGDSWEWAGKIGGNSWRTTGDLIDTWESLNEIGFSQAGKEQFAGPGHWNDPDMLAVGYVGWGEVQYPSRLTADEQFTHVSLWSLLAAPLLIGCDIIEMDEFTKSLFTNDEVIEINQDPLGKQASRIFQRDGLEIWAKEMEDGSKAVGLFNRNETTETIKASWKTLGITGKHTVRDVWRQLDEGHFADSFSAVVPAHGVKMITFRKTKKAGI